MFRFAHSLFHSAFNVSNCQFSDKMRSAMSFITSINLESALFFHKSMPDKFSIFHGILKSKHSQLDTRDKMDNLTNAEDVGVS